MGYRARIHKHISFESISLASSSSSPSNPQLLLHSIQYPPRSGFWTRPLSYTHMYITSSPFSLSPSAPLLPFHFFFPPSSRRMGSIVAGGIKSENRRCRNERTPPCLSSSVERRPWKIQTPMPAHRNPAIFFFFSWKRKDARAPFPRTIVRGEKNNKRGKVAGINGVSRKDGSKKGSGVKRDQASRLRAGSLRWS